MLSMQVSNSTLMIVLKTHLTVLAPTGSIILCSLLLLPHPIQVVAIQFSILNLVLDYDISFKLISSNVDKLTFVFGTEKIPTTKSYAAIATKDQDNNLLLSIKKVSGKLLSGGGSLSDTKLYLGVYAGTDGKQSPINFTII